ncbi:restriction endonuclease subunit S [uncultured Gardnerella sp.]|uniref:restriction endonuclease subunit S n=1 Tax=uncultured Gardnerella sp. TaxID=293424 RepID=UPI0025F54305|nr:restriction endonuclease subunit S [uncultured Gardnerella sp.]
MSKLEDLIAELCPDGVEYKALSEVSDMKRGTTVTKKSVNPGDIPVISGGREPAYYCDISNRNGETITVAGSGAGAGFVQYWDKPIFVCDAFSVKGIDDLTSTKFLYYVLLSKQEAIYATKKGGGVPHVHISSIKDFEIPIPPLDVQAEIVRILDTFTELTAELTAELTSRKKQYEYYRDALLTFDDNNPLHSLISRYCPNGVEYKALEEVASYPKNRIDSQNLDENNYVGVENLLQNKQGKTRANSIPKESKAICFSIGDVLIGNIRPYLKKIWFADCVGGTNGDVLVIHIHDKNVISPRFLYHILSSERFFLYDVRNSKGAKMPRGDKKAVMQFGIPIPPLEVQHQIVQILDRFDALCNDLTQGLPAEIEARRKQYEYYRDQLLTFNRI